MDIKHISDNRPAGVVQIGKKSYALGLFWQIPDEIKKINQEARDLAASDDVSADFTCIVKSDPLPQFGLGWADAEHKGGMIPLAALLRARLSENYLAVFEINNCWWVASGSNGLISPRGDAFYDDEQEARLHFLKEIQSGQSFDMVIAPASWKISNAHNRKLEDMIEGVAVKARLRPTRSIFRRKIKLIMLLTILSGGGVYSWHWLQTDEVVDNFAQNARLVEEAIRSAEARSRPWLDAALPSDQLQICQDALGRVPLVMSGWGMREASCTPEEQLTTHWERVNGLVETVYLAADNYQTSVQLADRGNAAVMRLDLEALAPRRDIFGEQTRDALWSFEEVQRTMWNFSQRLDLQIEISEFPSIPSPQLIHNAVGNPITLPTPPGHITFSVSAGIPIMDWQGLFNSIPGLIVEDVIWNRQSGVATLMGRIYVR